MFRIFGSDIGLHEAPLQAFAASAGLWACGAGVCEKRTRLRNSVPFGLWGIGVEASTSQDLEDPPIVRFRDLPGKQRGGDWYMRSFAHRSRQKDREVAERLEDCTVARLKDPQRVLIICASPRVHGDVLCTDTRIQQRLETTTKTTTTTTTALCSQFGSSGFGGFWI